MRTLLLQLPLTPAGPQAVYGQAWLDTPATDRAPASFAPLALLPAVDRRTPVAVIVPAQALSWHRITLPAGLGRSSARLQSALQGLLEEHLLEDPEDVHIAVAPGARAGEPTHSSEQAMTNPDSQCWCV